MSSNPSGTPNPGGPYYPPSGQPNSGGPSYPAGGPSYPSGGQPGPGGPSYTPGGPSYTQGGPSYTPGGPSNMPGGPMVSQASVQDVVNSWMAAITRPSVQTFAGELARSSQNRLMLSVGLATVIGAILAVVDGLFSHSLVGSFIGSLIGIPLGFLIGQGVVYLIARAVGGTGSFQDQAWVFSTFWAPILIITRIPIIGGLLGIVAFLYSLYLGYLALQPTHRLDSSKAMLVMGILLAIGIVLGACAFAFGLAAILGLAAASGGR